MKAIKTLIALLAFMSIFTVSSFAEDDPDFSDTDFWKNTCQVAQSDYYVSKCQEFMVYINDLLKKNFQTKLTLQANINEAVKQAANYQNEINKLQVEIDDLSVKINELKISIDALQADIEKNEAEVEKLQEKVLGRMVKMQSSMHFNPFFDFLAGAKTFSDLITRSTGIRIINNYDAEVNTRLKDLIEKLNEDKALLEEQKVDLDKSMEELETKQYEAIAKKLYYKDLEEKYRQEYIDVGDEEDKFTAISTALKENANLSKYSAIVSSSGWYFPVPGAYKSAGTWSYPSGGYHDAVDLAANRYSNVYAAGNGVVAYAQDVGCEYGYLGSKCGFVTSGGNMIGLIVSINETLYGLIYCHLEKGSFVVKQGDVVLAGEKIAQVGSSGSSTGPHTHFEIIYLGKESSWEGDGLSGLANYVANYNGSSSFGAGWKNYRRCDSGYSAPCRVRPENYLW